MSVNNGKTTILSPLSKVSPIIKPVSARCNIACDYCYYKHTHNSRDHGWKMPVDVLKRVVEDVVMIAAQNNTEAEFTWHGGEPTLAGLDFYRTVAAIQQEAIKNTDIVINNNIQTNGTLLNEDWVTFFKENNFSVGISIDGPQWLHDLHRFYHSGKGTFEHIMNNICLLKVHGVKFGLIGVVTEDSTEHAKEVVDFFVENEFYQFALSPCGELPGTPGKKFTVSPEKYADFMIEAFEHWLTYDNPRIEIRFLKQVIYGLMGAEPGLCSMGKNYCGAFPTITPNGDVFFCDNYEGSEDMFLGNILEKCLPDLIFDPTERHQNIRRQIMETKQRCHTCDWYQACGGGCPRYNRSGKNELFTKNNYFCTAYKEIISHVAERIDFITNGQRAEFVATEEILG